MYTNTMDYQKIKLVVRLAGGPVVASSNLVIPTAENERLTLICKSFVFYMGKTMVKRLVRFFLYYYQ